MTTATRDSADPESEDGAPESEPDERPRPQRGRLRLFILAAVLVQLAIPPTYYLRDDSYDERFAWRMFSGIRMQSCRTFAFETLAGGERPIALPLAIHVGWIEQLRRNRRDVVEGFLGRRCQNEGVLSARVVNHCSEADGSALEPIEYTRACGAHP